MHAGDYFHLSDIDEQHDTDPTSNYTSYVFLRQLSVKCHTKWVKVICMLLNVKLDLNPNQNQTKSK
jgi:hypothetical protein